MKLKRKIRGCFFGKFVFKVEIAGIALNIFIAPTVLPSA